MGDTASTRRDDAAAVAARSDVPRPNLAAVAALAGVSPSTASLAFSGAGPVSAATKAKVLAAAEQLDYAGPDPRAQSLRRGRSGIVGVVIEDRLADAFRDPMNIAMLDGIADVTGTAGLALLLLTDTGGAADIAVAPMDAVVLIGCSTRLDQSVVTLRQRGMPIVAIEAEHMPGVVPIDLDNFEATALGARHLRDLGHERVALVTLPLGPSHDRGPLTPEWEAQSSAFTATERIRGARAVFPDAGGVVAAGSFVEEGEIAGRALLSTPDRPTAVIAQSDLLAVGVIRAAKALGLRVPEDLSVLGFDGVRVDGLVLTTLLQPAVDKGRAAGRAILASLAGEPALPASLTSELRLGATTGPAPVR
ncbi:DNA-binding LacI/PurR family transcriptional regulator [Conyzicola lurida]|uniref:DNA-binding LacI/PurR family transcriptional regulator n=1 Tax=Conyzicola lurida TaxID=1172621 RepID=A0A841ASV4_9MICO|nr:LacI family DNA-binding transcriptional regulator [Conyzicola lurida]MBB5844871.1 DNA-binding LacI/PurR family transcriptional regulator [Conyzicola lurida]